MIAFCKFSTCCVLSLSSLFILSNSESTAWNRFSRSDSVENLAVRKSREEGVVEDGGGKKGWPPENAVSDVLVVVNSLLGLTSLLE